VVGVAPIVAIGLFVASGVADSEGRFQPFRIKELAVTILEIP
jgi:hypothetical protein